MNDVQELECIVAKSGKTAMALFKDSSGIYADVWRKEDDSWYNVGYTDYMGKEHEDIYQFISIDTIKQLDKQKYDVEDSEISMNHGLFISNEKIIQL